MGLDFPGDPVVKNLPANAEDMVLIPGLGRFHMQWGDYWSAHVCALQQVELQQWKAQVPQLESSPCSS